MGSGLAALAVLAGPAPAAAAPRTLTPAGPWVLDYSADSCTLARNFGTGDEAVIIRFEQFKPGPGFDLTFIGRAFRSDQLFRSAKLAFGPGQPLRPVATALSGSARTSDGARVDMLFVGTATLAGVRSKRESEPTPAIDPGAVSEVTLVQKDGADFVFKLGSMAKPMAKMQVCQDELLTHWGVDAAKQRALTRPVTPIGNPGEWLKPDDYPAGRLAGGESARINFRLTVSAEGKVTGCAIQFATKGDGFARASCDLLRRRARFQPALDAQGQPIASYYVSAVQWLAAPP